MQSIESADLSAKDLKGDSPAASVNQATPNASREKAKPCYRCGRKHDARLCKFKDAICRRCGKQGHISPACKTASPPPVDTRKRNYRPYRKKCPDASNQWLDVEDTDNKLPMFILSGEVSQPPIMINMILDGLPVDFEMDTGAAVTVMSEEKFGQLFPGHPLERSSIKLKTYTGEPMTTVGETTIRVSYRDQGPKTLTLVVVEGTGSSLLGRNWLHRITLDWGGIKTVLLESDPYIDCYKNIPQCSQTSWAQSLPSKPSWRSHLQPHRSSSVQDQLLML